MHEKKAQPTWIVAHRTEHTNTIPLCFFMNEYKMNRWTYADIMLYFIGEAGDFVSWQGRQSGEEEEVLLHSYAEEAISYYSVLTLCCCFSPLHHLHYNCIRYAFMLANYITVHCLDSLPLQFIWPRLLRLNYVYGSTDLIVYSLLINYYPFNCTITTIVCASKSYASTSFCIYQEFPGEHKGPE